MYCGDDIPRIPAWQLSCVRRRREVIEVTRYVSRNVFRNVFVEKRERVNGLDLYNDDVVFRNE